MENKSSELITKAQLAKNAARDLRRASTNAKNTAIENIARALEIQHDPILRANDADLKAGRLAGLSDALIDRLLLDKQRLAAIANDLRSVIALPDPVGEVFDSNVLANGIRIEHRRVPLGVIGVVYESRPNVTIDISALCLKSGNAVVLRGGKEASQSNLALVEVVRHAIVEARLNPDVVQFVTDTDRAVVDQMIRLNSYFDLFIPRGGDELIRYVRDNATVPAITGGIGVVHAYADESADVDKAANIIFNAKVQRPTVCNALDTLLVHSRLSTALLPVVAAKLASAGVEMRCDDRSIQFMRGVDRAVNPAEPSDFGQEFLSLVLSVRTVDSIEEAIDHIEQHGSGHTEVILTEDEASGTKFLEEVEASLVMVNASTRFNDGGQLGLGAEVAISTNKLHARGPMGLRELTTYKWVGRGTGQIRA